MSSSPAALLFIISLIAPHRSFMLNGLVKSEGPRGEHISAAFGSLTYTSRMAVWVPPTIHDNLVSHLVGSN